MSDTAAPTGDIRSAILAELAAAKETPAPTEATPTAPAAAPEVEAEAEAPAEEPAAEAEVVADGAELTEEPAPEADDEVDEEAELRSDDPETQKRLDQVRRAEKRSREGHARREADLETRERNLKAKLDRADEVDRLLARIKFNPGAVLRAAGVDPTDFELIAQSIYAESPALESDPKQKAAAQARLREREKDEQNATRDKEIAALKAKLEQQETAAKVQAEAAAYIQQLNTAAAKSPLVAHYLKADAEDTHNALVATYSRLEQKLQRQPKPAEVVAEYDRKERARLTKLGIDPATVGKTVVVAKKPVVVANKVAAAPVQATNTNKVLTPAEERESILAEIASSRSNQAQ